MTFGAWPFDNPPHHLAVRARDLQAQQAVRIGIHPLRDGALEDHPFPRVERRGAVMRGDAQRNQECDRRDRRDDDSRVMVPLAAGAVAEQLVVVLLLRWRAVVSTMSVRGSCNRIGSFIVSHGRVYTFGSSIVSDHSSRS